MYWMLAIDAYLEATLIYVLPLFIVGAVIRSFKIETSEEKGTFLKQLMTIWLNLIWRVPLWIITIWEEVTEVIPNLGGIPALLSFVLVGYVFIPPLWGPTEEEMSENLAQRQELIMSLDKIDESEIEKRALILTKILNSETLEDNGKYQDEYDKLNENWLKSNKDKEIKSLAEFVFLKEAKSIPASDYDANIKAYSILSELNPVKEEYNLKERYYSFLKYDLPSAQSVDRRFDECVDSKSLNQLSQCEKSCRVDPVETYCGIAYFAKGKSVIGSGCTGQVKNQGTYENRVNFCIEKACKDNISDDFEIMRENIDVCKNEVSLNDEVRDKLRVKSFDDFKSYYKKKYSK